MKNKILSLLFAFALIVPCLLLVGCGETTPGFKVYINDELVSDSNKTITLTYGDALDLDSKIEVIFINEEGIETTLSSDDEDTYTVTGIPKSLNANADGYDISITYGDYEAVDIKLIVNKKSLAKPTGNIGPKYTGESSIFTPNGFDENVMSITDNTATTVETKTATISLKDTANYQWADNTTTNVELTWSLAKAEYDMANVSWEYETDSPIFFDGTEKTVSLGTLPTGVSAEYTNNKKTACGTYEASVEFEYDTTNYTLINNNVENLSWKIAMPLKMAINGHELTFAYNKQLITDEQTEGFGDFTANEDLYYLDFSYETTREALGITENTTEVDVVITYAGLLDEDQNYALMEDEDTSSVEFAPVSGEYTTTIRYTINPTGFTDIQLVLHYVDVAVDNTIWLIIEIDVPVV